MGLETKLAIAKIQMEREGYVNPSTEDVELYYLAGSKIYYQVIDSAFRVSYWICKHTELLPCDEEYRPTFINNRKEFVNQMLQVARKYGEIVDYTPLTDRELVIGIEKCFKRGLEQGKELVQQKELKKLTDGKQKLK